MYESLHLVHFCRTYERNRPSIYSGLSGDGSYFPFWARKCGCAECIIAGYKIGTNSINSNQNGYKTSNRREYYSQTTNGYNQAHQTKRRLGEDQVYNVQHTLAHGTSVNVWLETDRPTASADRMQTHDVNGTTYIQNQADPRAYRFYQSAVCSQSAAASAIKSNSFNRMLNTNSVITGNEPVTAFWPWCGSTNEFNYQNQQHLSNLHQTFSTEQISRDPRLRKKSERCSEIDKLTSNKDSIYQANTNFVPVGEIRKNEGYPPQNEANKNKRKWEENGHGSLRETTPATWRNVSAGGHYAKSAHTPTSYSERSVPAIGKTSGMLSNEWKGQQNSPKQPMQLTLNALSNKRGTFLQVSDSHSSFPWDHSSHPRVKTSSKSEPNLSKGTKWAPKELENVNSRKRHGTGDLDTYKHVSSVKKKEQSRICSNDLENDQDAKNLEIYAREERIKNLKTLLVKHEQALDALRVQRKSSYFGETVGNTLDITNKEITFPKTIDQENIVGAKEESCSSSDEIFGNSLKRRWLKNWNEEDQLDHKPPEKIEKRNDIHSHGALSEEGNQDLSNAEFTALEGLVRLSKD